MINVEGFEMGKYVFRRKIVDALLEWKEKRSDRYAVLIQGARRVGKSTVAEEFAKKEFRSYILIDFANTSEEIKALFDDTYHLDFFFLQLQQLTHTRLYEHESVIIFDEVQLLPKARHQVSGGRRKVCVHRNRFAAFHPEKYQGYPHSQRRSQNPDVPDGF